jgi:FSR family fosmidomycin resistance protein-like MFS transporter
MLSAGHLVNDLNPGAVPALLPFLVAQRHYSLESAAGLVLAVTLTSSVAQPLLGHIADRTRMALLIPAGVLLAGAGLALTGLAKPYWLTFSAALLCGVGVGTFHPEASRFANFVSVARSRATGMSVFSVGGGLGFALGPALVTPLILAFGLSGTLLMALPSLALAVVLALEIPRLSTFRPPLEDPAGNAPGRRSDRAAFARLSLVAVLRSVVYYGLVTFVPLYFVHAFHTSAARGNTALTIMLVAGAAGTIAIGPMADRFGRRRVLATALAIVAVLNIALLFSGQAVSLLVLAGIGAAIVGTFGLALLMAQEYLPGNLGLASGLVLGLPDGVAGLSAPALGALGDQLGLRATLVAVAGLSVLMVGLAATLPHARPAVSAAGAQD